MHAWEKVYFEIERYSLIKRSTMRSFWRRNSQETLRVERAGYGKVRTEPETVCIPANARCCASTSRGRNGRMERKAGGLHLVFGLHALFVCIQTRYVCIVRKLDSMLSAAFMHLGGPPLNRSG